MLYDYIIKNYNVDEPVFLTELPGRSRDYVRQEMKRLVDEGKMERLYNGVYFLAYTTILGTKGKVSIDKFVEKKFLLANGEITGYITGLQFANTYGFTTQNPSYIEICTNEATTKQRKLEIDGRKMVIYKPVTQITKENKTALQFLDFMTSVDKYSEIKAEALKEKLWELVSRLNIDFNLVKKYINLYPDKVFKNIYQGGLMGELV